jgi:hypothetical protein
MTYVGKVGEVFLPRTSCNLLWCQGISGGPNLLRNCPVVNNVQMQISSDLSSGMYCRVI